MPADSRPATAEPGRAPSAGAASGSRIDERRAVALARALRLDAARVQLDEVADDGEAEAEAAVAPGDGRVGLAEAVEDVREELGRDSLAGVGDRDLRLAVGPLEPHLHPAAGGGELDGVRRAGSTPPAAGGSRRR